MQGQARLIVPELSQPGDRAQRNRALSDQAVAHWNAGEFWEAHEAWEHLWHRLEGDEKRFIQGLIQFAAALFHFDRGFFAGGFVRLMDAAREKTEAYRGQTFGIDWVQLRADLAPWIAYGPEVAKGAAFPEAPAPIPTVKKAGR